MLASRVISPLASRYMHVALKTHTCKWRTVIKQNSLLQVKRNGKKLKENQCLYGGKRNVLLLRL